MAEYYLAVDIGASGGRHILASYEEGRLRLEEVYRFENGMIERDGHLLWDTERLFAELLRGMKRCRELGKLPKTMGIDTWAVDYVLLNGRGEQLGNCCGYRGKRTEGMERKLAMYIPERELYRISGIQKQPFNTIYQLLAHREQAPEELENAEKLLLMPDYLNYRLTGIARSEYTNATTTQLVSPETRDWNRELLGVLRFRESLFPKIMPPGTMLGELRPELAAELGYSLRVLQVASHDTASAVMAVPAAERDFLYLSSGTWSLIGTELWEPCITEAGRRANFTNEGGYGYRCRFLKNIMGLWMIQSMRREWGKQESFEELCRMAEEAREFPSRVDPNDAVFLSPKSMTDAVRGRCAETGQRIPETKGELAAVIYQSLAESYARASAEIEALSGKRFDSIYIVGGGSNAVYLNALTAEKTGKRVYAGPAEATAVGNILAQLLSDGVLPDLSAGRRAVRESFEIREYDPSSSGGGRRRGAGAGREEKETGNEQDGTL